MPFIRNLLRRSNGKLGEGIHDWSLPAIGTCPGRTELCCRVQIGQPLLPFMIPAWQHSSADPGTAGDETGSPRPQDAPAASAVPATPASPPSTPFPPPPKARDDATDETVARVSLAEMISQRELADPGVTPITAQEGSEHSGGIHQTTVPLHIDLASGEKAEARDVAPRYAPKTVNTDGCKGTQAAWKALFHQVVILQYFLHAWLKVRDRGKHPKEQFAEVSRRVWEAYHAPDRRCF